MIDYALTLTAIVIFLIVKNRDAFIVAGAFVAVLASFELFEASAADYDLQGAYCFALMSSIWLAASVYVKSKGLSLALMSMAWFVAACGIMDAFMPLESVSTAILFELYPYAMIVTQIIVLIMAGRNGNDPLFTDGGALSELSDSCRDTFKAFGVR